MENLAGIQSGSYIDLMQRADHPTQIHRGFVHATIPELVPMVHSALDCRNLRPQRAQHLTASSLWMLIYFFDPAYLMIERPGQRPFLCARHTALLISPGTRYTVNTRARREPSRHIWMTMDGIHLTPLFAMIAPSKQGKLLFNDPEQRLAIHLEQLIDACVAVAPNVFWVAHVLGKQIVDLLSRAVPQSKTEYDIMNSSPVTPVDRIVGQVVNYLQDHVGERISLSALARHVHTSPSTVSHRYRRAAGESPMQTLNRLRLLRAKIRLVQGDTVENVAHDLGYYDAKHFSNAFRKMEGVSPSIFVKQSAVL